MNDSEIQMSTDRLYYITCNWTPLLDLLELKHLCDYIQQHDFSYNVTFVCARVRGYWCVSGMLLLFVLLLVQHVNFCDRLTNTVSNT